MTKLTTGEGNEGADHQHHEDAIKTSEQLATTGAALADNFNEIPSVFPGQASSKKSTLSNSPDETSIDDVPQMSANWTRFTPDTQGQYYQSLELNLEEKIHGGQIDNVSCMFGSEISDVHINADGNVEFNWTTPKEPGTKLTIQGKDSHGYEFDLSLYVTLNESKSEQDENIESEVYTFKWVGQEPTRQEYQYSELKIKGPEYLDSYSLESIEADSGLIELHHVSEGLIIFDYRTTDGIGSDEITIVFYNKSGEKQSITMEVELTD